MPRSAFRDSGISERALAAGVRSILRFRRDVPRNNHRRRAFLDLLADKVLVAGALIALVDIGTVSSWAAFLIIGREIAVMALRGVAALGQSTVPASFWGKSKAAIQFVAVGVAILQPDIVIGPWRLDQWLIGLAVVVTLVSAGDYFGRFRAVFSTQRDAV